MVPPLKECAGDLQSEVKWHHLVASTPLLRVVHGERQEGVSCAYWGGAVKREKRSEIGSRRVSERGKGRAEFRRDKSGRDSVSMHEEAKGTFTTRQGPSRNTITVPRAERELNEITNAETVEVVGESDLLCEIGC